MKRSIEDTIAMFEPESLASHCFLCQVAPGEPCKTAVKEWTSHPRVPARVEEGRFIPEADADRVFWRGFLARHPLCSSFLKRVAA